MAGVFAPDDAGTVAARLRRHIPTIIAEWEKCVRAASAVARHQPGPALRNSLPIFLRELADGLDPLAAPGASAAVARTSVEHARHRAGQIEYTLDQVIEEYSQLRQMVLATLETEAPLSLAEQLVINAGIDQGIREAAAEFVRQKQETLHESERQYREVAAELAEADRRKDDFLAVLGHELRTPISTLHNALQVLNQIGSEDERAFRQRAIAERQIGHLLRLVEDLLDVSRITRGQVELRRQQVDLLTVITHAVESNRPLLEERRHALTVSLPPSPLMVEADPFRLEQVITNLLTNAAKYTRPSGQIELRLERGEGEAVLQVRDNGIGIPLEMLPRIFDSFTQVARPDSPTPGGLGLGLAIVQRLVELHGGSVTANSDGPGMGTVFEVRLPLHGGGGVGPPE